MNKFKPGDKLRCIGMSTDGCLEVGKIYTCESIRQTVYGDYFVVLEELKNNMGYFNYRFELVSDSKYNSASIDNLEKIFNMQSELNDMIFLAKDIRTKEGAKMTSNYLINKANEGSDLTSVGDTNTWIKNYTMALEDEVREVKEELLNKFWSSKKIDMSKTKTEIIDCWHFLVSMSIAAGMTSNEVMEEYNKKYQVNINRQKSGY